MNGMPAPGPTAPATTAPDSAGMRMRGMVLGNMAVKLLEQIVPLLGVQSDEGAAVVSALKSLGKVFAEGSGDLSRQEVKLMAERTSPIQTPSPDQLSAFRQMIQQRQGRMMPPPSPAAPVQVPPGAVASAPSAPAA